MLISNPHDSLVKSIFSVLDYAADLFRSALPPALVSRLDFQTLTACPGSYIDEALRQRFTDLLYTVSLDDHEVLLYLLLEHQSSVERLMPYRLWCYFTNIWDQYFKDNPDAAHLPVIIPLVLHHSESGWTAATNIRELFKLHEKTREALGDLLPFFAFVLDDLSVQDDAALRARAMHNVPRLALWALKNARSRKDFIKALVAVRDIIREVVQSPSGLHAWSVILRYIWSVTELNPIELQSILDVHVDPKTREAYMTGAEMLIRQGLEQGLEQGVKQGLEQGVKQGLEQGVKQGREEAQRDMLLMLLEKRFGKLSKTVKKRVHTAKPEQLTLWADRIFSAQTLKELFKAS